MQTQSLLRIEEVSSIIGISTQTLNSWYRWRKLHPDNEYAVLLPDYVQQGSHNTRLWNRDDLWKLIEFKNTIPHGRNGILGDITQKTSRRKQNAKTKS